MRIVHVANFNQHKFGTDLYATDRKISAGLIRNGHFVYDFSYRDVCRNESIFRTTKVGGSKVNTRLIDTVDNLEPEILLLGHSELITADCLERIKNKRPTLRIGLWYVDALFHEEKMQHVFARRPYIDFMFATTGGKYLQNLASNTTRAAFIPNMVDSAVEAVRSFANPAPEFDFLFCGRDSGDSERREFMTKLRHGIEHDMKVTFRGCMNQPPVTGMKYMNLLANSRMGLNISRRNDVAMYSSDRIAQLTGCGLLTFCPSVPGMTALFAEDEIVYFNDIDDLLEKIHYYHGHVEEARKIAENGWQRAHRSYSCERVTRFMIECLTEIPFSTTYEWQHEIHAAG